MPRSFEPYGKNFPRHRFTTYINPLKKYSQGRRCLNPGGTDRYK